MGRKQRGDEDAYHRYIEQTARLGEPHNPAYDPFQKLLAIIRDKAIADANFIRWLYPSSYARRIADIEEMVVRNVKEWLESCDLALADTYIAFMTSEYRNRFHAACIPLSLEEMVGSKFSLTAEEEDMTALPAPDPVRIVEVVDDVIPPP